MKRFYSLLLPFFLGALQVFAQRNLVKLEKQIIKDRITLNFPDSNVVTYLWPSREEIKVDEDKVYYWFKANQIRISRGGYSGELLHGNYTCYYIDQNLKQKGQFKKGLKVGTWKNWHPNGERKDVYEWKDGQRNGEFFVYRSNNVLLRSGKYKKDKIKGKVTFYDEAGKTINVRKAAKALAAQKKQAKKDSVNALSKAKLAVQKAKKDSVSKAEKEMKPKTQGINPLTPAKEKKQKKKKETPALKEENGPSSPNNGGN